RSAGSAGRSGSPPEPKRKPTSSSSSRTSTTANDTRAASGTSPQPSTLTSDDTTTKDSNCHNSPTKTPMQVQETGLAHSGGEAPVAVRGGLLADEPSEELDVRPVVCPGLFSERGEAAGGGVEIEVAEIGLDLLVETGHASSPSTL